MNEMNLYNWMVCVRCMTFNHSSYIMDAMNGFCMQETAFPYVCTIIDDCSTDGEPALINCYLEDNFDLNDNVSFRNEENENYTLIFARHKTNKNCFFAVFFLKYNHYQIRKSKAPYIKEWTSKAKYIALCEGDDYWIDTKKLMKQVYFLERHPEHSLCIHAYRKDEYQGDGVSSTEIYKYPYDVDIIPDEDVINGTGMFGATASMVYRVESVKNYPEWAKRAPVGDRPLKFVLFARGHIAYINTCMSVYRVGVPGSWTNRIQYKHSKEKATREKFIQLLVDFDEWTNRKYHSLVKKAIHDYKTACYKNDIFFFLKKCKSFLKEFKR